MNTLPDDTTQPDPDALRRSAFGRDELRLAWQEACLQLSLAGLQRGLSSGGARGEGGDVDLTTINVNVINNALSQLENLSPDILSALNVAAVVPDTANGHGHHHARSVQELVTAATVVRDLRVALRNLRWREVELVLARAAAAGLTTSPLCGEELAAARTELAYRVIMFSIQAAANCSTGGRSDGGEGDAAAESASVRSLEVAVARAEAVRYDTIPAARAVVDVARYLRDLRRAAIADDWQAARDLVNHQGHVADAVADTIAGDAAHSSEDATDDGAGATANVATSMNLSSVPLHDELARKLLADVRALEREVVRRASVPRVHLALLKAVADVDEDALTSALAEASELNLVDPAVHDRFMRDAVRRRPSSGDATAVAHAGIDDGATDGAQPVRAGPAVAPSAPELTGNADTEPGVLYADLLIDEEGVDDSTGDTVESAVVAALRLVAVLRRIKADLAEASSTADQGRLNLALRAAVSVGLSPDRHAFIRDAQLASQRMAKVTTTAAKALRTVDRVLAESCLREAQLLGGCLDEDVVFQLHELLSMSDEELLSLQLRRAIENNDEATALRATMTAKQRFLKQHPNQFPFHRFSLLRSPQEFGAANPDDEDPVATGWTMLTHSTVPIPTSLTVLVRGCLPPCRCCRTLTRVSKCVTGYLQPPDHVQPAIQAFVTMQSFMGDRPSTADPAELAAALLHLGVTCPPLRDELYCQVVKQLSSGSDPGCSRRGWTLMYLFLEAFPPSDALENFLETFLAEKLRHAHVEVLHRTVLRASGLLQGPVTDAPGGANGQGSSPRGKLGSPQASGRRRDRRTAGRPTEPTAGRNKNRTSPATRSRRTAGGTRGTATRQQRLRRGGGGGGGGGTGGTGEVSADDDGIPASPRNGTPKAAPGGAAVTVEDVRASLRRIEAMQMHRWAATGARPALPLELASSIVAVPPAVPAPGQTAPPVPPQHALADKQHPAPVMSSSGGGDRQGAGSAPPAITSLDAKLALYRRIRADMSWTASRGTPPDAKPVSRPPSDAQPTTPSPGGAVTNPDGTPLGVLPVSPAGRRRFDSHSSGHSDGGSVSEQSPRSPHDAAAPKNGALRVRTSGLLRRGESAGTLCAGVPVWCGVTRCRSWC